MDTNVVYFVDARSSWSSERILDIRTFNVLSKCLAHTLGLLARASTNREKGSYDTRGGKGRRKENRNEIAMKA